MGSAPTFGSLRVDYPAAKRSLPDPSQIPAAGRWSPGEYVALAKLMEDRGARYQICGPSAFNFHGLDEQVPQITYAYNNRISRDEN